MKRIIIFFISFLLISCKSELDSLIFKQFQKFINKYKKKYSSINEYFYRYQYFRNNVLSIVNSKKSSFKKGITQFSDLTKQEFSKTYLNLNYDEIDAVSIHPYTINNINLALLHMTIEILIYWEHLKIKVCVVQVGHLLL